MIPIEEYIQLPKEERQKHLKLTDPCLERGGPKNGGVSYYCKGLMAHILNTSIPCGYKIHICHSCNNQKCSNPNHLYWGTAKENCTDAIVNGKKSIWECMIDKYGIEEAKKMQGKGNKSVGGKIGGSKPKSTEHKKNLSDAAKKDWAARKKK